MQSGPKSLLSGGTSSSTIDRPVINRTDAAGSRWQWANREGKYTLLGTTVTHPRKALLKMNFFFHR